MSSLGQMVAGVAHEINNPVNFIYGNLAHAREAVDDLIAYIHTCQAEASVQSAAVQQKAEEIELDFLEEDLPRLFQSMQLGAERTRQIVLSLRNFSRLDELQAHPVDLHECLDNTLMILSSRLKREITVIRHYDNLPKIEGFAGSLYQVFMNILSNACDALGECSGSKEITITTEQIDRDRVAIRIADNGPGIALEHQANLFEPFFTTKPVGIGTGLGLSISHEIVVEKHGGQLICASTMGVGTQFSIILPVKQRSQAMAPLELATV